MKKINLLLLSLILTILLTSKSYSITNNEEFIKLKETHDIFCKNLNEATMPCSDHCIKT